MLRSTKTLAWAALWLCMPLSSAQAAEFRFGVNAAVSYNESEFEVRRRYNDWLTELGKAVGHKLVFVPIYSDRVEEALDSKRADFLLIHTHFGLRAQQQYQYQLLGFSEDRANDRVHFFVTPGSPIKSLTDIGAQSISSPGNQTWATVTARATLRSVMEAVEPDFRPLRLSDAVVIATEMRQAKAGISRSQKLIDEHVKTGRIRVVHSTERLPLYALVAGPQVPPELASVLRATLDQLSNSRAMQTLPFKAFRYTPEEVQRLSAFYSR